MSETSGTITYDSHYDLADRLVKSYDSVSKNAADIRNTCIVKYQRIGETLTLPVSLLSGGNGTYMFVTVTDSASFTRSLIQMEKGQEFEIFGCPDSDANGKFTLASTPLTSVLGTNLNFLSTNETVAGAVSATSAGLKSDFLRYKTAYACNTVSIARYGLRNVAVYEGSNENIDTPQEALALATNIVSDLAEPTADVTVRVACGAGFELHDLVTLLPDVKQRWTSDLDTAVVSVREHFEGEKSYVELGLRAASVTPATSAFTTSAAVPTGGTGWIDRIKITPLRPGIADKINSEVDLSILGPQLGGKISQSITAPTKPPFMQGIGGRRRLRNDYLEVHISTDPSFIPSADTLAHVVRGT